MAARELDGLSALRWIAGRKGWVSLWLDGRGWAISASLDSWEERLSLLVAGERGIGSTLHNQYRSIHRPTST